MKTFAQLVLLFGLMFGAVFSSIAATTYASAGNAFSSAGGSSGWGGTQGSVSGGIASADGHVSVGGVNIPVSYSGTIMEAGALLVAALIKSPSLATGSTIGWLAGMGIMYANEQWMKHGDPVPVDPAISGLTQYCWADSNNNCYGSTPAAAWDALYNPQGFTRGTMTINSPAQVQYNAFYNGASGWQMSVFRVAKCTPPSVWNSGACSQPPEPCPSDYTYHSDGTCWPNSLVPATDSDWAKVRGETPPDQVLNDLCKKLQGGPNSTLGCAVAGVQGSSGSAPISEWSQDSSGQWHRDVASVRPSPSATDPERVSVSTSTETKGSDAPVDPATGKPTDSGSSEKTPDTNSDFCVLHPDSIACATLGDAPDVPDIDSHSKQLSITPDSGWGPDSGSCPPDLTYTTHDGLLVRLSYSPVCQGATAFRPVVIGLAWVSAVMIFLGVARRTNA